MFVVFFFLLTGCSHVTDEVVEMPHHLKSQVLRHQSRTFDMTDERLMLKSVVLTMQNLGFIIDKTDEKLGVVSGTSFVTSAQMIVSVSRVNASNILVKVSVQTGLKSVEPIESYQNFFSSLSQSLSLEAHLVD